MLKLQQFSHLWLNCCVLGHSKTGQILLLLLLLVCTICKSLVIRFLFILPDKKMSPASDFAPESCARDRSIDCLIC